MRIIRTVQAQTGRTTPTDIALREARTALGEGHLDEALRRCEDGVRSDPRSALAYFLLGMIQMRRGDQTKAREALLQSLKLDPAQSATHYYLGKIYLAANQLTTASREFEASIRLGDPSGASHYGLGLTLLAESRYEEAIPHLKIAVKGNPQDPEKLYTLLGAELQLKRVGEARSILIRIRERFPLDPSLAYRLGKALLEYSLPADAEAEFERASGLLARSGGPPPLDLNVSDLHLQMARLRFDVHDYWGALKDVDKVTISDVVASLRASVLHLKGQALVGIGRATDALEKLRQAAQMNPANPEYLVHLTWAQLLAGDIEGAGITAQLAEVRWPNIPDVQLMRTLLRREADANHARVPLSQQWHLKGEGLVCCPCKVPCPCRSNGAPTNKHCENTGFIRIHNGHYGKVSLDGFAFVTVNSGTEMKSAPDMLYVEPSASAEQLIALERIMQSFNPLQPSMILNVERAPISFGTWGQDNVYDVNIPKILEIRIRRELNGEGEPLFLSAALDQFSNTIEYARNLTYKLWDQNGVLKWDYSGRQANFRTIDLDSRAYNNQNMLIQFADGSGAFNKKQLELIRTEKLPLPHKTPQHESTELQHIQ
jgi:tetratricopeptide (TPR) repeat protein